MTASFRAPSRGLKELSPNGSCDKHSASNLRTSPDPLAKRNSVETVVILSRMARLRMALPRIEPLGVDRERRPPPSTFRRCPLQKRAASSAIERGKARPERAGAVGDKAGNLVERSARHGPGKDKSLLLSATSRDGQSETTQRKRTRRENYATRRRASGRMARRKRWPSSGALPRPPPRESKQQCLGNKAVSRPSPPKRPYLN